MEIDASLVWVLGVTVVAYGVAMFALAVVAQGKIHNAEDYIVAGRRLPLSLSWMTLLATWFGAGTLLTAADEVRRVGLRGAALDPLGAGVCLLLAGLLVAAPMWRERLLTLPDFFGRRFSSRVELVSAVIMVPGYFGWIAAQFVALAGMLELFFGIDPLWGIALVAAVGTGYTLMGGMWAVTMTDAVQVVLILVGLLILGGTVLVQLGDGDALAGLARLYDETPAEMRQLAPGGGAALVGWLGVLAVGALGNLPGQDLIQRVFAARSATVARRSCYVAGAAYLAFGAIPVGLGLAGRLMFPERSEASILPAMSASFLSPALAVVFTLALMSAVLSTIDSAILAPATVLARNIMGRFSRLESLRLNRLAVLLVGAGSLACAYAGENAYSLLEGAYEISLVGLFVPLMFGLYTRPRDGRAAMASMTSGTGLWLVHYVADWETLLEPLPAAAVWPLPVSLTATLASLVAYLAWEPPWRIRIRRAEDHPS